MSKANEIISLLEEIKDPNSSGQGNDASHSKNPLHDIITKAGFKYSHSTPVTIAGDKTVHHTYKKGERNVGVHQSPSTRKWVWESSKSSASGRSTSGTDPKALEKHLKNK